VPDAASEAKKPKLETSTDPPEHSPLAVRTSKRGGRGRGRGRGARGGGGGNRRDWHSTKPARDPRAEGDDDANEDKEKRLPKRKVCVLIGYCGTGLSGSQMWACPGYTCANTEIP
jgi:tRNA pseudouridine38-40 synthase